MITNKRQMMVRLLSFFIYIWLIHFYILIFILLFAFEAVAYTPT